MYRKAHGEYTNSCPAVLIANEHNNETINEWGFCKDAARGGLLIQQGLTNPTNASGSGIEEEGI